MTHRFDQKTPIQTQVLLYSVYMQFEILANFSNVGVNKKLSSLVVGKNKKFLSTSLAKYKSQFFSPENPPRISDSLTRIWLEGCPSFQHVGRCRLRTPTILDLQSTAQAPPDHLHLFDGVYPKLY